MNVDERLWGMRERPLKVTEEHTHRASTAARFKRGNVDMSLVVLKVMAEHLQRRPDLLPGLLNTLFEVVLFEECSNQWSMSRPMLSLILINEQIYPQLKARLIASQPLSRSAYLLCIQLTNFSPVLCSVATVTQY